MTEISVNGKVRTARNPDQPEEYVAVWICNICQATGKCSGDLEDMVTDTASAELAVHSRDKHS